MSTDTQTGGQASTGRFDAVREQAEALVHQGVETINESASRVQENVRSTAQSYVDQAKSAAAGELEGVAQFVRNAIPSDNAPPIVSQYANQAAESLEQLAQSLKQQDLQSLIAGVNQFARRQPALFLGASVAVGFVAARFLRSKSPQSEHRYGAPVSSLYPPQDFQHGHGATSPALTAGAGERAGGSGAASGYGQSSGSSSGRSYGGQSGGHSGGGQSGGTSYGAGTRSGTSGGSSTQGAGAGIGGSGNSRGGEAGGANTSGGTSGGGLGSGAGSSTGGSSTGGTSNRSGSSGTTSSGGSADRGGSPVV